MSANLTAVLVRPLVVQLWFLYSTSMIILHRFGFLRRSLAQQLENHGEGKRKLVSKDCAKVTHRL